MAKKRVANSLEAYPREEIEYSFLWEANRRNLSLIVWYKRLINLIMMLLIFSGLCILISAIFAWKQPLPDLYATSQDGVLHNLEYDENADSKTLGSRISLLTREEESKKSINKKGIELTKVGELNMKTNEIIPTISIGNQNQNQNQNTPNINTNNQINNVVVNQSNVVNNLDQNSNNNNNVNNNQR